jgi:hypothetical protein
MKTIDRAENHGVLRRILKDVEPLEARRYDLGWVYADDISERLPLPYMVRLTLLLGTNCKHILRPFEKTAWAIHLEYKGVQMRLEHGKFGMRLATPTGVAPTLIDEFIATLQRAFRVADRLLQPLVEDQIRRGNVTIPNIFHRLDARYAFFRKRALRAYTSKDKREERIAELFVKALEAKRVISLDPVKPEREGFYYAAAALDAYFSRLEHVLALVLPFVAHDPSRLDLLKFIASNWTRKIKAVFDLGSNQEANKLYDELRSVKERYRNPLSHGGFEKDGASLLIHVRGIGAVPTRLSGFKESIHYEFFPVTPLSFGEACKVFDAVDRYLKNGPTRFGWRWMDAGLNVAFDNGSIKRYRSGMVSDKAFDALVGEMSQWVDAESNMDW